MIIDIPVYIQIEGILERKRKVNFFQCKTTIPVDIKEIEGEFPILAVDINRDHTVKAIPPYKNIRDILTPYIEYENELYEPYEILISEGEFLKSQSSKNIDFLIEYMKDSAIKNNMNWNLSLKTGISETELNKINGDSNKFFIIGEEKLPIVEEDDFKRIVQSNYDFRQKQVQELADHLIFINGGLFRKSMGPNLKMGYNTTYSYPKKSLLDGVRNGFYKRMNEVGYIPYSMASLFDQDKEGNGLELSMELIKDSNRIWPDINIIVFEPEKLYDATHQYFGIVLYEMIKEKIDSNILRISNSETNYDIWSQHMINKYPFGQEMINKIEMCKDSQYDLDVIEDALSFISLHFNDVTEYHNSSDKLQEFIPNEIFKKMHNFKKWKYSSDKILFGELKKIYNDFQEVFQNKSFPNNNYKNIIGEKVSLYHDFDRFNLDMKF